MKKSSKLLIAIAIVTVLILAVSGIIVGIKKEKENHNLQNTDSLQGNESINSNSSANNVNLKEENKKETAKLEIIRFDTQEETEKIDKTIEIRVKDKINLEEYQGNEIEILEINERGIKISRNAKRYEIINQTGPLEGEKREYKENVVEEVNYGEIIRINIDSADPFGPDYARAKYEYSIKVVK